MSRRILTLDIADARRIIAAGERKAMEMHIPYNIAVVGAVGASRGSVENDVAVARAAVAGLTV